MCLFEDDLMHESKFYKTTARHRQMNAMKPVWFLRLWWFIKWLFGFKTIVISMDLGLKDGDHSCVALIERCDDGQIRVLDLYENPSSKEIEDRCKMWTEKYSKNNVEIIRGS